MKLPKKHHFKFIAIAILLVVSLYTAYSILHTDLDVSADCLESTLNEGLISAGGSVTGNTGNVNKICITGTQDASYREFKVPLYQNLEDQFFTLSRANVSKAIDQFNGNFSGNGLHLQTNNLTINSAISGSGTQVIFVRGNLDIMTNIDYGENDPNSGLVFIVSGNINIAPAVTKINAVLISSGFICTATSDFTNSTCYDGQTDWQQLIINGSLISINKNNLSEPAIKLGRNLELNTEAAERVNKEPKYLYNLRGGLFTKDLIITSEDQLYKITTTGTPSPSPSSAPPLPGPVVCNPLLTNPATADDQQIPGCVSI